MKSLFSLLVVASIVTLSVSAQADVKKSAAPSKAKSTKAKAPKLTEVNVCPMTGESSEGSDLSMKYKNYNVHFCCPGCDTSFAKLSATEKDKKIAEALKEQKKAPAKA